MREIEQLAQLLKDRNVDCLAGTTQKLIDADFIPQTTLELGVDCRNGVKPLIYKYNGNRYK